MIMTNNDESTLVVILDSYDSPRALRDITDSSFHYIDIICRKHDVERFKTLNPSNGVFYCVENIDYNEYAQHMNTIKNSRSSINAIALSSNSEMLIEIVEQLRNHFNISEFNKYLNTQSFIDKYEIKMILSRAGISTPKVFDAIEHDVELLMQKKISPVFLKLKIGTARDTPHFLKTIEDFKTLQKVDMNMYFIEEFIEGNEYKVIGVIRNSVIKFFAIFCSDTSYVDYYVRRLPKVELLVLDTETRSTVESICHSILKTLSYTDGTFAVELIKSKADEKFYFLSAKKRLRDRSLLKLLMKYGIDLSVQMIRIDSFLEPEQLRLPDATCLAVVTKPIPNTDTNLIFDSVNLVDKHKYSTLIEIETPDTGELMQDYDNVNAIFASYDENLLLKEVDSCRESLKITFRSTCLPNKIIYDLRSDTLTLQNEGMKYAMLSAIVGDAAFGEDETVNQLENYCASLFRKEAALFVSTGTMTNQVSIKAHTRPGEEVITDAAYHINFYESAQTAAFCGVTLNLIRAENGIITVTDIKNAIDSKPRSFLYAKPSLIFLENTVNAAGGTVFPIEELKAIKSFATDCGLAVHMDGARVLNACVVSGLKPCDIACYTDSISMCFSKGLGAPFGSILCGSKSFIEKAKIAKKWFGGTLHQSGYMAAAALYALNENWEMILRKDHEHARLIAIQLSEILPKSNIRKVETNIVIVDLVNVVEDKSIALETLKLNGILAFPWNGNTIRFVTSRNISDKDAITAARIIRNVFEKLIACRHKKMENF